MHTTSSLAKLFGRWFCHVFCTGSFFAQQPFLPHSQPSPLLINPFLEDVFPDCTNPTALTPWVCILSAHRLGSTNSHRDFQGSWRVCHMWKLRSPTGSPWLQRLGYQVLMLAQELLHMNELLSAYEWTSKEVCVNSWNWVASERTVSWARIEAAQRPQAGIWASAFTRDSDTLLVSY